MDTPGEASGLVDVAGRVLLEVDTRREWQQIFYEGWAATVRHVHPSILAGIDPEAILAKYAHRPRTDPEAAPRPHPSLPHSERPLRVLVRTCGQVRARPRAGELARRADGSDG